MLFRGEHQVWCPPFSMLDISLSQTEIANIQKLARGYHGKILLDYLNKLEAELNNILDGDVDKV